MDLRIMKNNFAGLQKLTIKAVISVPLQNVKFGGQKLVGPQFRNGVRSGVRNGVLYYYYGPHYGNGCSTYRGWDLAQ